MMMILPLRYTHIGRCFRVVAEYTLNPPTRGLNTSDHLSESWLWLRDAIQWATSGASGAGIHRHG